MENATHLNIVPLVGIVIVVTSNKILAAVALPKVYMAVESLYMESLGRNGLQEYIL
jgi:hypothetical protein